MVRGRPPTQMCSSLEGPKRLAFYESCYFSMIDSLNLLDAHRYALYHLVYAGY
jgi:hypothetical protein